MIGVMIVPTGIGAAIGGHAGDATPAAKLLAACCDKLIIHPNVVNASDINEMSPNMLYVEGSILDRFLEGGIQLREVRGNRILVVANAPLSNETINAVAASEATIGIEIQIVELGTPLVMISVMVNGIATGRVSGTTDLVKQIEGATFDALAIHTSIKVDREVSLRYFREGGVNPWGGVEAKASRLIANDINKPVAHAPLENTAAEDEDLYFIFQREIVDKRQAAETISNCYLHSVLKGLHRAPRLVKSSGLSSADFDFMVSPAGCYGRPHRACQRAGILIIVVRENTTVARKPMEGQGILYVDNYLEAAGAIMAMGEGMSPSSVRSRQ